MANIAVVYKSKYGWTKKYSEWLAAELGADIFSVPRLRVSALKPYDTIIWGGGLYAGSVNGLKVLSKNFSSFKSKRIAFFTVGMSDPSSPDVATAIPQNIAKLLTPQMLNDMTFFHLRGGMDVARLSFFDRTMMNIAAKMLGKIPVEKMSPTDREMLEYFAKNVDLTDKNAILQIVNWANI